MKIQNINKFTLYLFFLFYLIVGIYTLKDYGINIEEHTQLYSGFYWLNYVFDFFQIDFLKNEILTRLNNISLDQDLPDPKFYTYGPIFDLPTAFLDILFNSNETYLNFNHRHFLVFLIYYLSSIAVFKILNKRFNNFFISFFGTLLYIFSPRIYGDSFHNNKDIIFLSLVVFSIYFAFKIFKKKKLKNIFLFSFFAALATSTRIMGLFLPTSLIIFIFLQILNSKFRKNFKYIILIIISYLTFLYVHWPLLWEAPIINFFDYLEKSKDWVFSYYILFNGKYVLTTSLPDSFIFTWIGISTPILNIILLILGVLFLTKRLFYRIITINDQQKYNCDFWRGENEMMDYFIFFNFVAILSILITLNASLVSGWRHLYFLNFFIIYFATFFLKSIYNSFRFQKNKFIILFLVLFIPNIYKVIIFHPFQSLYLNEILNQNQKNNFLIDREGLTRLDSIRKILSFEKTNKIINIANASYTPYYRINDAISSSQKSLLNFVGTDYEQADYIFNNYVYEVDPNYDDKYKIPSNFKQIYILEIDGIKLYEIFKKE